MARSCLRSDPCLFRLFGGRNGEGIEVPKQALSCRYCNPKISIPAAAAGPGREGVGLLACNLNDSNLPLYSWHIAAVAVRRVECRL